MNTSPELMLALFRGLEVLGITGVSGLCIYLGFRLFDSSLKQSSSLKFEWQGTYFEMRQFGPGVAFAIFGAAILIVMIKSTTLTIQTPLGEHVSMAANPNPFPTETKKTFRSIKAINQSLDFLSQFGSGSNRELAKVKESISGLNELRADLIDNTYGAGTFEGYQVWLEKSKDLNFKDQNNQKKFEEIKSLLEEK
ncbi:hypothetical protein [Chromobacterium vaccinii]|uniref:hypothetical protein n=1 Tax=Chromobacterium vaccinii TaxID=1108595 RepID=UPI001319CAAE|nr:hypothetical protein [Chromobacterium vaccinii]